jgi:ribosomal protein L31E
MMLHDLFDWSNAGVGAVGLVLTIGAIWQATGAKKAATEARKAVYRRSAADAMVEIVRIAEQLNTSVLYERGVEAVIQLRELVFRIPRDREEFASHLASDGDKLRELESNCRRWADILGPGDFPLSAVAKKYLFNETLNTVQELSAIQGRLRRMLDQEEK